MRHIFIESYKVSIYSYKIFFLMHIFSNIFNMVQKLNYSNNLYNPKLQKSKWWKRSLFANSNKNVRIGLRKKIVALITFSANTLKHARIRKSVVFIICQNHFSINHLSINLSLKHCANSPIVTNPDAVLNMKGLNKKICRIWTLKLVSENKELTSQEVIWYKKYADLTPHAFAKTVATSIQVDKIKSNLTTIKTEDRSLWWDLSLTIIFQAVNKIQGDFKIVYVCSFC